MAAAPAHAPSRSFFQTAWDFLSSVRTGIILLILVVVASVTGTLILQRPITEPEQLARAYKPETLRWLDAAGLTDVFHSPWFVALMCLLAINIVCASIDRFPAAWRFYSRPYRKPDAHFLAGLPLHKEIPLRDAELGLEAAERALKQAGLRPQRVANTSAFSVYAERHRFARLAAYVVHVSLLLILAGGIVDAVWGYRGYLALGLDEQSNQIDLRNGLTKALPFTIRCDGAGQENYTSGAPKRWWSKLAVMENGREVMRKEIEVNDPLTYGGIRFFQSGYGSTGQVGNIRLTATPKGRPDEAREIVLRPGEIIPLDEQTTVSLAAFVPDLVIIGDRIETRSEQPNNPAIQLSVVTKAAETKLWLFPKFPGLDHPDNSPYKFAFRDLAMGYFTGLQVSYEPGQWAVWAGCVLMGVGLIMAFYFVHLRYWAVPVRDASGRLSLWLGASASKNREELEEKFGRLVECIEREIRVRSASQALREAIATRVEL
jgi:cytochrome c biogenesis protein